MQHKLKQFILNINHCRCYKAFEVLIEVYFTITVDSTVVGAYVPRT